MHQPYNDIKSRIKDRPLWYDGNGTPRYEPFHPRLLPDIYADEAVLYLIRCQSCGEQFRVSDSSSYMDRQLSHLTTGKPVEGSLRENIEQGQWLHYGDPPFHPDDGQCAGTTMNCEDLRILEFWERKHGDWVRVPGMEILLPDSELYGRAI